ALNNAECTSGGEAIQTDAVIKAFPGTTRRRISTSDAGPVIRSSNAGATACSSDTRPRPPLHQLVLGWSSPSTPDRSAGATGEIILIASSLHHSINSSLPQYHSREMRHHARTIGDTNHP
ncbi:hypothetical protein OSI88_13460, partial [Mycobacterium ulcerans]